MPIGTRSQVVRFALVGILNTGWSYFLYAALLYLGLGYSAASFLTIVLSVGFGFVTQGTLVFGGASRDALIRFVFVWVLIYAIYLVIVASAERFGVNNYIGGLIATPVVACLSFLLQRKFVFRPQIEAES